MKNEKFYHYWNNSHIWLSLITLIVCVPQSSFSQIKTWDGSSGAWSDVTRWIPNGVPVAGDTAVIFSGQITLDTDVILDQFIINGGSIFSNDDVVIDGNVEQSGGEFGAGIGKVDIVHSYNWLGGTLGAISATSDTIFVNGETNISGGARHFRKTLVSLGGGTYESGELRCSSSGWVIGENSVYNFSHSEPTLMRHWNNENNSLVILGILQKTGDGVLSAAIPWIIKGSVSVDQIDQIVFSKDNAIDRGNFGGLGSVRFSAGTTTISDTSVLTNIKLEGGVIVANSKLTIDGDMELFTGDLGGPGNININGNVIVYNGVLGSGHCKIQILGDLNWLGGSLGVFSNTTDTIFVYGETNLSSGVKHLRKTLVSLGGGTYDSGELRCSSSGWVLGESSVYNFTHSEPTLMRHWNNENNSFHVFGDLIINGEEIIIQLPLANTGVLKGNGKFTFQNTTFTNQGAISPGLSAGHITLQNISIEPNEMIMEIIHENGVDLHDSLSIIGHIDLSNTILDVSTIGEPIGDAFVILTWTESRTGEFSNINAPGYSVLYDDLNKQVLLSVVDATGCTNLSAHNYDPNATSDDGSCESCSDGIQNGDETSVDCGGTLCAPCCGVNTIEWTGVEDTLWSNPNNWCENILPGETSAVVIPSGALHNIVVDIDVNIKSFDLRKSMTVVSGITFTIEDFGVKIFGDVTNHGTINMKNWGTREDGSLAQNKNHYNDGTITLDGEGLEGNAMVLINSDFLNEGSIIISDYVRPYSYTGNSSTGITLTNGSNFINNNGVSIFNMSLGIYQNSHSAGVGVYIYSGASFQNNGTLGLDVEGDAMRIEGELINYDMIDVFGGDGLFSSTGPQNIFNNFSISNYSESAEFIRFVMPWINDGDLFGSGKISGQLTNNGSISPSNGISSGFILEFDSVLINVGSMSLEIHGADGLGISSGYDQIILNDGGQLGGDLDIVLNYTPSLSDQFVIVSAPNGYTGSFSQTNLPDIGPLIWEITYANDAVIISVGEPSGCPDPSAHNYDANATSDDSSCETCSDGIQNGDETGVDCGGVLCGPCLPDCPDDNYALLFDDVNNDLDLSSIQASTTYSVEMYVYFNSLTEDERLLSAPSGSTQIYAMRVGSNDELEITTGQGAAVAMSETLEINQWYHVAISRENATTYRTYINGVDQVGPISISSNVSFSNIHFGIPFSSFGNHFDGYLDEFRIWEGPLSQADILSRINGPLNGDESNLVAYFPMAEGAGLSTVDISTNGYVAPFLNAAATDWVCGAEFQDVQSTCGSISFSTNPNFESNVVFPTVGNPLDVYRYEAIYTNSDGLLPNAGFPKVLLDYEGDGNLTSSDDMIFTMEESDPADTDVTDGKTYYFETTGLIAGENYMTTIQANNSCGLIELGPQDSPNVLDPVDINVFASDIQFSNVTPSPNAQIDVTVTIHNMSSYDANNFSAQLSNQFDGEVYPDITGISIPAGGTIDVTWTITTPNEVAFVPIEVNIDIDDVLPEPNELDNKASRPFINGAFEGNTNISVVAQFQQISPTQGLLTGTATYEDLPLPLPNNFVAGAQVNVTLLEDNQNFSTLTDAFGVFSIPMSPPAGALTFDGSVTDFTLTGVFEVTGIFLCKPDLVVSNLTAPTSIQVFENFDVGFTITNNGCLPSLENSTVQVSSIAGFPVTQNVTVPPLAVGESFSGSINLHLTSIGSNEILTNADIGNDIDEYSETNNTLTRLIQVLALPCPGIDLRPTSISVLNPINECGRPFTVNLYNNGTDDAGPFEVVLQSILAGQIVSTETLMHPGLTSETSDAIIFFINFDTPGIYEMKALVDMSNNVDECDENNNETVITINVAQCDSDLQILCAQQSTAGIDATEGDIVDLSIVVSNFGSEDVTEDVIVDYDLPGAGALSYTIFGGIPSGGSHTEIISLAVPNPGNAGYSVEVDPNNQIIELNESNNVFAGSIGYDFEVEELCFPINMFWQNTYLANQPILMNAGITNNGLLHASEVQVQFEVISGPGVTDPFVLSTGIRSNVYMTCGCPLAVIADLPVSFSQLGVYEIRMTVDANNIFDEISESNNNMIVSLEIVSSPDYLAKSEFIEPTHLNPNIDEEVYFDISYQNIGETQLDSFKLNVFVDELLIDQVMVPGLVTGDIFTTTIPTSWSSDVEGAHIIRYVVDSEEEILEPNEQNNEATRAIIVGAAPNLFIATFESMTLSPQAGQALETKVSIENGGLVSAMGTIKVYQIGLTDTTLVSTQSVNLGAGQTEEILATFTPDEAGTYSFYAEITNVSPQEYNELDNSAALDVEVTGPVGPPTLIIPADMTLECPDSDLPANTGTATAEGDCEGSITIDYTDNIIAGELCLQEYTIVRTWMATDDCENIVVADQYINVADNTAPILTLPPDVVVQCGESVEPVNTGLASALDNCDALTSPTFTDFVNAGSCAETYTIERTWRVEDLCGNVANGIQVIDVIDDQPPVALCTEIIAVDVSENCAATVTISNPTYEDCSMVSIVNNSPFTSTNEDATGIYPIGETIVTFELSDACGNVSTCATIISVIDNMNPIMTCPSDTSINIEFSPNQMNPIDFYVVIDDLFDAQVEDDCGYNLTNDFNGLNSLIEAHIDAGTNLITWSAMDESQNESTCTFEITIIAIPSGLGCTDPASHNFDADATTDDGSCETCSDGIQNGDEIGVDCGGSLCAPCSDGPVAVCNNIVFYVNLLNPDHQAGYFERIWLVDSDLLDGGSSSSDENYVIKVRRLGTYINFDWTTNGACVDGNSNGVINYKDNGKAYRKCLPLAMQDIWRSRKYRLRIIDSFGQDFCSGKVFTLLQYSSGLSAPTIQITNPYASDEDLNMLEKSTDRESEQFNELSIYPNPGIDILNVEWNSLSGLDAQLQIIDMNGKVLIHNEYQGAKGMNKILLDVSRLTSGMYLIKTQVAGQINIKRWVKGSSN